MAASHEDTSRIGAQLALRRAYPPRSHDKLSLHPSISTPPPARTAPGTVSRNLLRTSRQSLKPHRHMTPMVGVPNGGGAKWWRCQMVEVPNGGGERDRPDDLLLAKQALSQL